LIFLELLFVGLKAHASTVVSAGLARAEKPAEPSSGWTGGDARPSMIPAWTGQSPVPPWAVSESHLFLS
jgi:hypothetical protein